MDPFSVANGIVTSNYKLKRVVALEVHQALIETTFGMGPIMKEEGDVAVK